MTHSVAAAQLFASAATAGIDGRHRGPVEHGPPVRVRIATRVGRKVVTGSPESSSWPTPNIGMGMGMGMAGWREEQQ